MSGQDYASGSEINPPDYPDPFEPIPEGVDLREASPGELRRFGLPARPNRALMPALFQAWARLLEPPFKFSDAKSDRQEFFRSERHFTLGAGPNSRFQKSRNWAGASVVADHGKQFVLTIGGWTIPTPLLPGQDDRGNAGVTNDYHCSCWIGLDGTRRYLNSSLPQIGTEQILTVDAAENQSVRCRAWFQWWARTQVTSHWFELTNVHVCPEMFVMAAIWAVDPHHVICLFRTFGNPSILYRLPIQQVPEVWLRKIGGPKGTPSISGASAEWVVERPMTFDPQPVLELFPDYSPVTFESCVAGMAHHSNAPTEEKIFSAPRWYRMYETLPTAKPKRARLISMPSPVDSTSLTVKHGGF